jgi:hypothetical protein
MDTARKVLNPLNGILHEIPRNEERTDIMPTDIDLRVFM